MAGDTATIVISDDDDLGLEILALGEEWVAGDLMKPCFWVIPSQVERLEVGPPIVMSRILGSQGTDVDLLRELSARQISLLRVIVLQALTHERASAEHLVRACQDIADLVRRAMPVSVERSDGPGGATRLLRMNVVVPESDLRPQNLDILQPDWEFNVLVSPEDRADIDRANTFVRAGVNLSTHALSAVNEIGALWRGAPEGPFDTLRRESQGGSEIFVVRCQARVIRGDDRLLDLSCAVIDLAQNTSDGVTAVVSWGIPAAESEQWARSSADCLLKQPGWLPQSCSWVEPKKQESSLGSLVKGWASFQLSLPGALLGMVRRKAVTVLEDTVTDSLVGSRGDVRGRLVPLSSEEAELVAKRRLAQGSAARSPQRLETEAANWSGLDAESWRLLRELCVGVVDGSPLPAGFARRTRGDLVEILAPRFVVPDPVDVLTLRNLRLHGVDCKAASTALTAMSSITTEGSANSSSEVALTADEPIGSNSETSSAEKDGDQPLEIETRGVWEQSHEPDVQNAQDWAQEPADASGLDHPKALIAGAVGPADDDTDQGRAGNDPGHSAPAASRQQVHDWLLRRRKTLLGQVAEAAFALETSQAAFADEAWRRLNEVEPPDTKDIERARGRLTILYMIGSLVLLAFVVAVMISAIKGSQLAFVGLAVSAFWLVVGLFLMIAGGTHYYQAVKAFDWRVTRQLELANQASENYVWARRDARRWSSVYQGVLDWADILAELFYRPWSKAQLVAHEADLDPTSLPAAVALAKALPVNVAEDSELVRRAINEICRPGWVSRAFSDVVELCPSNSGGGSPSGSLPADLDLGLQSHGPRASLAKTAADQGTREYATRLACERLKGAVVGGTLLLPELLVVRQGPLGDGSRVTDRCFLSASLGVQVPFARDLFSEQAQVDRVTKATLNHFNLPPDIKLDRWTIAPATSLGRIVTRADMSRDVTPDDLSLFPGQSGRGPAEPVVPSDDY